MPTNPSRLDTVIREIDEANAADPRVDVVDGIARPRELIYAERMSHYVSQLYPQASEILRIAARAQHVCRWQIPRQGYPAGRDGYNAWRGACREHHASLVAGIMGRHGFAADEIARACGIIRKQRIKSDPDSQALENVVGVVFVRHYLADFIASHGDYDEPKLLGILRQTLRKMDGTGHAAVVALALPDTMRRLIEAALAAHPPAA